MQIIIFELQGQEYAMKTQQVEEITKLLDITPVPNAPHYTKGLVNLRGNVVSIMELSKILNKVQEDEKDYSNIIMTKVDDEIIGMLVGEVHEVMDIEEDMIEKVSLKEEEQMGIKGIIQVENRIINFLTLEEFTSIFNESL